MLTLIESIEKQNDTLTNTLADLAKGFQFDELLALIQPRASES